MILARKGFVRVPPRASVDRKSAAYFRVTAAGFVLFEPTTAFHYDLSSYAAEGEFKCVCGKIERYLYAFIGYEDCSLDIAGMIEKSGGVSVEHLRNDGYSEEQIREIRAVYSHAA